MNISKRDISNVQLAMILAEAAAEQSKCVRSKVGSVVITKAGGMFVGDSMVDCPVRTTYAK